MKKTLALLVFVALLGAGCQKYADLSKGESEKPAGLQAPTDATDTVQVVEISDENTVVIENNSFSSKTFNAKKGEELVFKNNDENAHTATSDNGFWDSGVLSKGQSFTVYTASLDVGSYSFASTLDPDMKATLIIE